MVRIELLRDLRIVVEEEERPLVRSRKARLVLAFLAVKPGMHAREVIANTFWGEGLPETARNSLSKELGLLRKALGDGLLAVTRDTVGLPNGVLLAVDVREFDNCLEQEDFTGALNLWQGDFLQDTAHPWADSERIRYRRRAARAYNGAAGEAQQSGDLRRAVALETAADELDPRPEATGLRAVRPPGALAAAPRQDSAVPDNTVTATAERDALAKEVERLDEGKALGPLLFGLGNLDAITGGLPRGSAMIIAGRPNMGVTTLALTMTLFTAVKENRGCAFFSPEFGEVALAQRLLAMRTGLSGSALRKGRLSQKQWPHIVRAAHELETSDLYIDDSPDLRLDDLTPKVSRLEQELEGGLDLVVIDDAHLLSGQASIGADEHDAAEVLFSLRRMSRVDGPAIVMTTKVSAAVEDRLIKRPSLQDIPGYSDLASRPEQVLLLFREDYYDPEAEPPGKLDVLVAENRHGPTGRASLKLVTSGPRIVDHEFSSL